MTDDLSLYLYDGCFFCERVRRAARELGIEIEERNIFQAPQHMKDLIEARGRRTVPVLRIASEEGPDEWMPESADIVRYLQARFGDGEDDPPPRDPSRYGMLAMWGLWLAGAVASEPLQSVLWTAACAVAGVRSGYLAIRSGAWLHWAVAAAFVFGATSIALSALDVVDLPWWYAAFAVAAAVLGGALFRRPQTA